MPQVGEPKFLRMARVVVAEPGAQQQPVIGERTAIVVREVAIVQLPTGIAEIGIPFDLSACCPARTPATA